MDTSARSWAKSLTWRAIGIVIMPLVICGVGSFIGDDMATIALWSTVIFNGLRIVLYYFHERAWGRVEWGTNRPSRDG